MQLKQSYPFNDSLVNKITYCHLVAFVIALPFERFYSELILGSFALHIFIHATKERFRSVRLYMMLPAFIYLLTIAGTLYTTNKDGAFSEWGKQLSLFLFPLLFSLSTIDLKKIKIPLLKIFGITCILAILWFFVVSLFFILENHWPLSILFSSGFTNHNFSAPIGIHATYFSMYVLLSGVAFIYLFIQSTKLSQHIFYGIGIAILAAGLIQLSSRAVFISALVVINIVVPLLMLKKNLRWRFIFFSLLISLIGLYVLTSIDSFRNRYVSGLKEDLTHPKSGTHLAEPRVIRWGSAIELIRQSPVIGHGSGNETDLLREKYYQQHLYISFLNSLNSHNQYLSFLMRNGVIGLLAYLFILVTGFINAIRTRDPFFCTFMIIIAVVSFSENILDVNKGIFYFAFFFSLFAGACSEFKVPFMRARNRHLVA